ncbi:hypothetical protein [Deinococcus sp. NW-56]|uniref:hypothetical protein n=1 Tax=Deinococcus sp. NW-56 TaxID=2080419 RepID=UPI000CF50D93|nr:hypothetical protein [Deinococcus sp. NW-56]
MRLLLTSLLLALPVAAAAGPTGTFTVQGHSAGTFGHLALPEWVPAGGAAWSPDSREVYTLDTTGELRRWQAATGAALGRQVLAMPREVGDAPTLSLRGMTGEFLHLEARGWRQNRPVRLGYTFSPRSRKTFRSDPCPISSLSLQVCTQAGQVRARVEGQDLVRIEVGKTTRFPLPKGVKPVALALSDNGGRLALLAILPKDSYGLHGTATLFLREGETWRPVALGQLLLEGTSPSLTWVGNTSEGYGLLMAVNAHDRQTGALRNGQFLALYREDGARVWDLSPQVGLRGAWPSPDGRAFVTLRQGSVPEVRRLADGGFLRGLGEAVTDAVPLSGQRALVALQRGGGLGRVALLEGKGLRTVVPLNVNALAALRGDRFASAQANLIRLHDFRGRVLRQWNAAGNVQRLAFSPDGTVVSAQVWNPRSGQEQAQAWTAGGQPLPLTAGATFPVSRVVLTVADDKNGPEQGYRERLSATSLSGKPLWRTDWRRGGFGLSVSADGRWAALSSMAPDARRDPVEMEFWRLNTATGQAGPVLRLKPTTPDPNSGWGLAALSADGRLALLREGSGDACGWALYGYALADLSRGRRLAAPASLAGGFNRLGGCGRDLPFPDAAFAPDGRLLVRDGNTLTWWRP